MKNSHKNRLHLVCHFSGFIQVRQNLMASNSTIDLTDEDDAKPQRNAQNNPPALVALNMRNKLMQAGGSVRHIVTTQQPMRAQITPTRKLPAIGMHLN